MPTDRQLAGQFAENAAKIITAERGTQHGELEPSFTLIAEWWSSYINHAITVRTGVAPMPRIQLDAVDALEMMSLLKKARSVYGSMNPDHSVDDIGYTALAGGLRLRDRVNTQIQKQVEEDAAQIRASAQPQSYTGGVVQPVDGGTEPDTTIEIPAFLRQRPETDETQGEGRN